MKRRLDLRFGLVVLAAMLLVSAVVACGTQEQLVPPPATITPLPTEMPEPTGTLDHQDQAETRTFEELLASAMEFRSRRDVASALVELALAESLLADKSYGSHDYQLFLLRAADTYAWFERLDEAEAALLKATGIPDEYVGLISDSRNPLSEDEFREVAGEIEQLVSQTDSWGYHVALSLIYNILGDSQSLERKQQAAMDVSDDKEMTLAIALELYEVRGRKQAVHSDLEQQKLRARQEPHDWSAQYQLALGYHLAGWFPEAQEIVDPYLSSLDPEDDEEAYLSFLFLKMNLEMSLGHYEAMTEYEAKILAIDPHALDEFSE